MKRISVISAIFFSVSAIFVSCKKDFKYVFAEKGPELSVRSCSESAFMGAAVSFSVEVMDDEFDLSTLKAQLYFDEDKVSETTIRTKEDGLYEGEISVPFMADIPDGRASVVFVAQNVGQAVTRDTVAVNVSRPVFDNLILKAGDRTYEMEKTGDYTYSVEGDFPAQFNALIETPVIPGTDKALQFGWDSGAIVEGSDTEIPFSNLSPGYTVTFNTLTFEGAPFIVVYVNGEKAEMADADSYVAVVELEQGKPVTVEGLGDMSEWYIDPDYFETDAEGGMKLNATTGNYQMTIYHNEKYFTMKKLRKDGSDATFNDGALWMMAWGLAHPVMTRQFGFVEKNAFCMAEIRPKVFQFTGKAVAETDGVTKGGRFRYDYISAKYFFQNAWGGEMGLVTLSDNAAEFLKPQSSAGSNLSLIDGKKLTFNKTFRLTIDLSECTWDGSSKNVTGTEKVDLVQID